MFDRLMFGVVTELSPLPKRGCCKHMWPRSQYHTVVILKETCVFQHL